jgi:hypothetical protein
MDYSSDPRVESAFQELEQFAMPSIFVMHCRGSGENTDVEVECNTARQCLYTAVSGNCSLYWRRQLCPALNAIALAVEYTGDIKREISDTLKKMELIDSVVATGSSER